MDDQTVDMRNPFGMPEVTPEDDPFQVALSRVAATPEGRAVLWGLLSYARVSNEVFAGNSTDIYEKGRRSTGLWLITQMAEVDPTIYPRLLLDVARQGQRAEKLAQENEAK